jgi:SNF family Na+-dependent transporter
MSSTHGPLRDRSLRHAALHDSQEHAAGLPATEPPGHDGELRQRWSSQWVFVLASIGSAIGFGNLWRFPMLTYEYGACAFIVPYVLALFATAIPMVVLEFGLGQMKQLGHVKLCASLEPRAVGFGWASVLGTFLVAQYYNALLAYCVLYLFASFQSPLPWTRGGATAYFASVAQSTAGPHDSGGLVPALSAAYMLVWVLCYAGVRGGAKGIGRLVQLLMPAPFIVLAALLLRGAALEGAGAGVHALFTVRLSVARVRVRGPD